MDEATKSSLITQGVTAGIFSQYIQATYAAVLPWLIPAIPLILLVCKYGRINARRQKEEVTWCKTIKMAINRVFNYICWIMISCTLSVAFNCPTIAYVIMAIIYGLELLKCILRYVQSQGYKVSEKQALALFLKIIIQKLTNTEVEMSDLTSPSPREGNDVIDNE